MISIVTCSRRKDLPAKLKQNIADTIGCEYELVVIDNSKNTYNIFQAYNEGVRSAKGDILCFMHDDILFLTTNWGAKVQRHLKENVGLIGVIGNLMLPNCPSSWWTSCFRTGQIVQRSHTDDRHENILFEKYRIDGLDYCDSVIVDGLWFCMPKTIFSKIRFDEDTFNGFHCYDSDICMQVLSHGWEIHTIFDISIEHYSIGPLNNIFFKDRQLWYKKWRTFLPIWRGISLTDNEAKYVSEMALLANEQLEEKTFAENTLHNIQSSKAYRLVKAIKRSCKWIIK